ncbi:hypothetical protein NitYY0826_C1182 [Nitratiruptor sp. YY08-26]|nr:MULTISPECIES: hypothetical protein [unclassified Nitratiruptor]BCD62306.1 hypothetical protein NitYY0813_C1180 [Nitratiruptor sp. YY08-13]BCD66242.1 hypothetical protein NitYY0826_C1182 [Nitratiruptor sp. YY08-26]
MPAIQNDNELDAFVAWLIAWQFVFMPEEVEFRGNVKEAILLPKID